MVFVNPEFALREGRQRNVEGCLSVPGVTGEVERFRRVQVIGQSLTGRRKAYMCEGYEAACLQHEMDHLDGILFIDRLSGEEALKAGATREDLLRADLFRAQGHRRKPARAAQARLA
jgi:peptide deformylase